MWVQVASVIDMVEGYSDRAKVNDEELSRRIDHDPYMKCAVIESYDLLIDVLRGIVTGERELRYCRESMIYISYINPVIIRIEL